MPDIVLINPKSTSLGSFDFLVAKSVPLGLGYLAAYLMKEGRSVKIIDEEIERLTPERIKSLASDERQLFGISCLTPNISRGYELADMIKSALPKSAVVFGGIHPTVMPDEVLGMKSVDLVVRGEAEPVIGQIVDAHKSGRGFDDILSCSFRQNGVIKHNERAPLIDMDLLPDLPYHLFDSKIYDMGFIISSRGCPYNCVFCSQRAINGNKFRYRSNEKVINEIKTLTELYAPSNIVFFDDIFTINKKRIYELCKNMMDLGLHKKAEYTMVTRGDCIDDELLSVLKQANFTGLAIGVETANEDLMKMIDKRETVKDIENGIKLAKKYGFLIDTVYIFGLPGETRADRAAALKLARSMGVTKARFNNATPYPGTRLYDMAKAENNLNIVGHWENFHPTGALTSKNEFGMVLPYYPKGSSKHEIIMDVLQANMLFFLQPERLWKLFKNSFDRRGTKWLVLPQRWWTKPRYVKGVMDVTLLNVKRLMWLLKWWMQGKLLSQHKGNA